MKKILTLICTLLCANVLLAQTVWVDGLQYSTTAENGSLVAYVQDANSNIVNATIHSSVVYNGLTYTVRYISSNAFENCSYLTSITIPNTIWDIGNKAFKNCNSLTSITIPNSDIGDYAFENCSSLISITIPDNIDIGDYAFKNCSSLTSITIPNSVTSIGDGVFFNCSSLTSITIPNNVTSIGHSAFYGCSSLTSVTIPNSVTSIGNSAFENCSSLTSITIPNNVTSIEMYAFEGCGSLTSVTIGNSVTEIDVSAFRDCSSLTSVTIPNSVTHIRDGAFRGCSSLTSITIPNSVTYIGSSAFLNCSSLTSVTIPDSVTYIAIQLFYGCNSLTSVTIGNSVTSIGYWAFKNCSSLTTVNYNAIDCNNFDSDHPFENCPISTINIGDSVQRIPGYFAYSLDSLTEITIPNSVTSIGNDAFRGCSSLTSITIPNSVTSIGNSAFRDCSSLTSVTCLRSNSPSLGDYVFNGTPNNKTLTVPCGYESEYADWQNATTWAGIDCIVPIGSLFTIGDLTYEITSEAEVKVQACTESATSVVIPETVTYQGTTYSVTTIGEDVFASCNSLTSMTIDMNNIPNLGNIGLYSTLQNLTLGENVTSIASGAFNNYSFLQNITCLATTPPTLADNTVFPYPNIATLTVPCGTLEAYSAPTSLWNTFFAGRISDGYNVVATTNDNAFGSVAVESDCYTATLTATASDCYEFLRWNDGNTENPRLVSLSSDTAFTAIFSEVIHNTIINASINPGETYTEYGFNASEAGTYIHSVTTEGCDSIITLILTVNSSLLEAEIEEISFYPNPTDSKVIFSQMIEKVEVIDLTGKVIFTFRNESEINVESLPAGAYYLRLTNNDKAVLRKLIKE